MLDGQNGVFFVLIQHKKTFQWFAVGVKGIGYLRVINRPAETINTIPMVVGRFG